MVQYVVMKDTNETDCSRNSSASVSAQPAPFRSSEFTYTHPSIMSKSIVLVLGIFLVVVTVGNIHLMWQWCGWDAVARVSAATTAAAPAAFVISQQDEKRKNKADSTSFDREACLRDVLQNLPLGTGRPRLRNGGVAEVRAFAHHYDAGNRARWNANLRLEPIDASLTSNSNMNCSIWEVGANTEARDSRVFLRTYPPHCQLHAYEPIPPFFAKLQRHWQAEPRMTVHPYGLAAESTSFGVSPDKLKGQSTFIGESQGGTIQAKVVALSQALQEANHIYPKLLSINCEGASVSVKYLFARYT